MFVACWDNSEKTEKKKERATQKPPSLSSEGREEEKEWRGVGREKNLYTSSRESNWKC